MSTISAVKSWSSNEVLTASDLNSEFSNLITNTNSLNSDNLDMTANYTWTGNLEGASITATAAFLPDASGGANIGSASLEFGDLYLADTKTIYFGNDQDITLAHVADTGLTLAGAHANGTNLQLNNTATDGDAAIQFALSGTVAYSLGVEDGDSDKFVINYGTGALGAQPALEIDSSGNTSIAGTLGTTGAATLASLVCTAGATFGGGYGATGTTISTAGVFQTNGAATFGDTLSTTGAATLASLVCTAGATFGGGYGSTGTTISTAGVFQTDGAATFGSTLSTTGAATLASLVCTAAATFGGGTGSSGATISTAGAGTFDGILKTEDATDATSTTDGSLQTDGGLSVAKDAILGNDVKLLTDSSVLSLGIGSDATFTHDGTTGVTIAANPVIVDSGDALTLDAHTGIFIFKDAGSEVLRFTEGNSGDVTIKLETNGKDLVFTDNGDATNMKILDAAAGINVPGEVQTTKIAYTDGDDAITIADGGGVTTSGTLTIGTVAAAGSDTDKFLVLDGSGNVDYRTGSQVLSDIGGAGSGSSTAADDISDGDAAVSIATTTGNITIDAQANDADVIIKVDDGGSAVTALTLDGSDEGNAIFVNDVQLKSDSALLEFGADLDTSLTHTDGTGLTLNSTNKLTFGDTASFVQQSADGTLRIDGEAIIDLRASTGVGIGGVTPAATLNVKGAADTTATQVLRLQNDSDVQTFNVTNSGIVQIYDDTANGKMSHGLTINQAAQDSELLAFKSSDVAHAMTDFEEADTWGRISKTNGGAGGLGIRGFRDADSGAQEALALEGILGEAALTTDSTSTGAVIQIVGAVTDGSAGATTVANGGNLFSVQNWGTQRVIIKGDGTVHASDTSWATALDDMPDALAGRAYTTEMAKRQGNGLLGGMEVDAPELVQRMEDVGIVTHAETEGEGTIPGHRFLNVQKGIKFSWDMGFQNFKWMHEMTKVLSDDQRAALPEDMRNAFAALESNERTIEEEN